MIRRDAILSLLAVPVSWFWWFAVGSMKDGPPLPRPKPKPRNKKSRGDGQACQRGDYVMQAVGEASMCWEHPERAGTFDAEMAEEIGNRIRQHFADGIGDFATARIRVCDQMRDDDGLRIGYRANIACAIFDNLSEQLRAGTMYSMESCNEIADHVMCRIFDLERP